MSEQNPDPEPRRTPGLEPGGQVPPGETPRAEGGTSWAEPEEKQDPSTGGPGTPMIVLAVLVAVFVAYFIVWALFL